MEATALGMMIWPIGNSAPTGLGTHMGLVVSCTQHFSGLGDNCVREPKRAGP